MSQNIVNHSPEQTPANLDIEGNLQEVPASYWEQLKEVEANKILAENIGRMSLSIKHDREQLLNQKAASN